MASDIMGLLIALFAENVKGAKKTKLATYGYVRADAVGSLINTTFLLSTCFTIAIDALARFREVDELAKRMEDSGIPLLIVASIGLGINIIGLLCFGDQMHVMSQHALATFPRYRIARAYVPHAFQNRGILTMVAATATTPTQRSLQKLLTTAAPISWLTTHWGLTIVQRVTSS
jgi:Co/Zn/Cd efflux system component